MNSTAAPKALRRRLSFPSLRIVVSLSLHSNRRNPSPAAAGGVLRTRFTHAHYPRASPPRFNPALPPAIVAVPQGPSAMFGRFSGESRQPRDAKRTLRPFRRGARVLAVDC
jgi:hypothetical protein